MVVMGYTLLEWVALGGYELLLFAGLFFMLGALDDFAVDLAWIWLKIRGKARCLTIDRQHLRGQKLRGRAVVMIPTWHESDVIGATVSHALEAWPHAELRIYIGCYRNDAETAQAVMRASAGDSRIRLVIHGRDGPSSKADCLNRIYAALRADEQRSGESARMILLHDAEDMVDEAALSLLDAALDDADFAQLPVLPQPQPASRWIAGHYCDEFAEAHGKAMVVREALGAGLPAAGVGCAFSRRALDEIALRNGRPDSPFASECLTEDYELGLKITEMGGKARFLRARGEDGLLVATRAYFPDTLIEAVRQKTRWIHGIAFQGWDRLGWEGRASEKWMRLRDRRGPLTALVLAAGYILLVIATFLWVASLAGLVELPPPDPAVRFMLMLNVLAFLWRAVWRFAFTTREYGVAEGLLAIIRIPFANVITIMAGRRALAAYLRTLKGHAPVWDKTEHRNHPAMSPPSVAANKIAKVAGPKTAETAAPATQLAGAQLASTGGL